MRKLSNFANVLGNSTVSMPAIATGRAAICKPVCHRAPSASENTDRHGGI
jgi:hypothetical protein